MGDITIIITNYFHYKPLIVLILDFYLGKQIVCTVWLNNYYSNFSMSLPYFMKKEQKIIKYRRKSINPTVKLNRN